MQKPLTTVLLDIGGIVTPDPWEVIWLTQKDGLADRLGLSTSRVREVGAGLFEKYSVEIYKEEDYWQEFSELLGVTLPPGLVSELESQLIYKNPFFKPFLHTLRNKGIRLGIISNNTAFWFPKELNVEVRELFTRELIFLSHLAKVSKRQGSPNLFGVAASKTIPEETLIIDDRPLNLKIAKDYGFRTQLYDCGSHINESGYYQSPNFVPFSEEWV